MPGELQDAVKIIIQWHGCIGRHVELFTQKSRMLTFHYQAFKGLTLNVVSSQNGICIICYFFLTYKSYKKRICQTKQRLVHYLSQNIWSTDRFLIIQDSSKLLKKHFIRAYHVKTFLRSCPRSHKHLTGSRF